MHLLGGPEIWDALVVALLELLAAETLDKSPPIRWPKSQLISFPAHETTSIAHEGMARCGVGACQIRQRFNLHLAGVGQRNESVSYRAPAHIHQAPDQADALLPSPSVAKLGFSQR